MTKEEDKKTNEDNRKLTRLDCLNEVKFHKSRKRYLTAKKYSNLNIKLMRDSDD